MKHFLALVGSLKLGVQLNIAFLFTLYLPLLVGAALTFNYYIDKIKIEAFQKATLDLKVADLIYTHKLEEIRNLVKNYAQDNAVSVLFGLNLNEKLGRELAKTATKNGLDMILVVDKDLTVVARSHQPKIFADTLKTSQLYSLALKGKVTGASEILSTEEIKIEKYDDIEVKQGEKILTISGTAPIFSRNKKDIIGFVLVRQIINNEVKIVNQIANILGAMVGIFEDSHLVATSVTDEEEIAEFDQLEDEIIEEVIVNGQVYEKLTIEKNGHLTKYQPIKGLNGKPIGALMIRVHTDIFIETRNRVGLSTIGIAVLIMFLVNLMRLMIQKRILSRIDKLTDGTKHIANGQYNYSINVRSKDEIGQLANSFNNMAHDLDISYQQLKDYNKNLENKVAERTSALGKANDEMVKSNKMLQETLDMLNPGVSQLISQGQQLLGLVEATELITDVAGYTRLNMILGEKLMGEMMVQFFRESHRHLAKYLGFRDKTVGDQIIVTFGIPKDKLDASPYHPFDAIFCALQVLESVKKINESVHEKIHEHYSKIQDRIMSLAEEDRKRINLDEVDFNIRIGINTSNPVTSKEIDQMRMVMMGAETGVDYTGQGGALIYAARLEGLCAPSMMEIGENTKQLVEHIFELEKMPDIRLKGLGQQSRYRVKKPLTALYQIYPGTNLYQTYNNKTPEIINKAYASLKIGYVKIPEIQKIEEYTEISAPFLEHSLGVFHLSHSKALWSYAICEKLGFDDETKNAIVYCAIWNSVTAMKMKRFEMLKYYTLLDQLPENINQDLVNTLLEDLNKNEPQMVESFVLMVASDFDESVFDRSYLRVRQNEIISINQFLSQSRELNKYPDVVMNALDELFKIPDDFKIKSENSKPIEPQADNKVSLLGFIDKNLSVEQKELLVTHIEDLIKNEK